MYVSHNAYESITARIIVSIITINTSIIEPIHKFLFHFFVLSTKSMYFLSKSVLMFILYVFSYNNIVRDLENFFLLNETFSKF